jgi:hypothetical protein
MTFNERRCEMDDFVEPPYVEIDWHSSSEKVAEDGGFTFGVYLSNNCIDFALEQAVLDWACSIDDEKDINLTIRLRLRDVFSELYDINCNGDGSVDEEGVPLFDALRKDCEWIIKQVDELKICKEEV